MVCRSIGWLICTAVAAVAATNYSHPDSTTESSTLESAEELKEIAAVDLDAFLDARNGAVVAFIKGRILHVMATKGWAYAFHSQPGDLMKLIRQVSDPQAETSAPQPTGVSGPTPTTQTYSVPPPATGGSGPTLTIQTHSYVSDHEQTPATATTPTATQTTPQYNEICFSLLRRLPAQEKGRWLIQASKEGSVDELQALLAAGVDVGARDESMMTALHWTADRGHVEAVRCLMGAGSEVEARDFWQQTPLHLAARSGHAAVVWLLLAEGSADPNAREVNGWTPLHYAAASGLAEVAAALLEARADRSPRTDRGQTPLDLAKEYSQQDLVQMLTQR